VKTAVFTARKAVAVALLALACDWALWTSPAAAAANNQYLKLMPNGRVTARAFVVTPRNGVRANTLRVYRRARLNAPKRKLAPLVTAPQIMNLP